jgi:hypothetical protein
MKETNYPDPSLYAFMQRIDAYKKTIFFYVDQKLGPSKYIYARIPVCHFIISILRLERLTIVEFEARAFMAAGASWFIYLLFI